MPLSLGGVTLESPAAAFLWCFIGLPMTSILSARLDAGSKLARICCPSWIAETPAASSRHGSSPGDRSVDERTC